MSRFATALARWMESHRPAIGLVDLQAASGIAHSELSRIRRARRTITLDALTKLLPAVERMSDRDSARTLLVAYLRDETPERYAEDVSIFAPGSSVVHDRLNAAPDPLDQLAARWRQHAERDPEFADMWLQLDGYMHSTGAATDDARRQYRDRITEPRD